MSRYDVTALGELLIDFTENGISPQGNPLMEANPGGAPCNVLAMLNSLGHKTGFIGKIGQDMFGDQLEAALREVGISTDGLKKDEDVHTTLAFVHTASDGDREFSFYRNPGADMMLSVDDVDAEQIKNSRIFHFGSLSMTHDICRKATKYAVKTAEEAGCLISFDPNLREPLWSSPDDAKEQITFGLKHCDILKISDNEIQWYTGLEDYDEGIGALRKEFNIPLVLLSMGREGSRAYFKNLRVEAPAFINPDTIETTGAGDTFGACILHYVLANGWKEYTEAELRDMLTFANAAASIVTTRRGALRAMPSEAEVRAMLSAD
ncbi:MAG: carbohydrate kinase [Parasporobacterium sp.]|nr:carbohydrate kinase [Parasporobacterium sp.]